MLSVSEDLIDYNFRNLFVVPYSISPVSVSAIRWVVYRDIEYVSPTIGWTIVFCLRAGFLVAGFDFGFRVAG